MAEVSQKTKYVKLDDGVSFSLVRTNPKLTTNTKLMYNGKKMYMESYASSELLNRTVYKNVYVKSNSTYNKDIARFLTGSGSRAYEVYQNFSDITISDSYDNQYETLYWCGAEYIESSFYTEEIGFVAPLYLREKLPNYFLIFRLDTPSNYNLTVDSDDNILDSSFDFKTDILDKAVLIKTFDLREGSVLGNYIHNYVEQDAFEFDKSMYVNFSNAEVTYYGINKFDGVFEKKVENFENELLRNDNPIMKDDKWFTEGFERNGLIFPYIMNIEYLFDDDNFKHKDGESYDFARYIGLYCNTIEFGEFNGFDELNTTKDNAIYYFEDNKKNLHRYVKKVIINNDTEDSDSDGSDIYFGDSDSDSDGSDIYFGDNDSGENYEITIDGKDVDLFDENLISGFEDEKTIGYAEPLDIYEGFINRSQYDFEILKPLEPGDWIGIEYNGYVECYFADDITIEVGEKHDDFIGNYGDFRFAVSENSSVNDIAKSFVKCVNNNKKSKFEARCSNNFVVLNAKREGEEYNEAKILIEESLIINGKISSSISDLLYISENNNPIEDISDSDMVIPVIDDGYVFGNYYIDNFHGACNAEIDSRTDTYKNVFKIYMEESVFFSIGRYLKTKNGDGRRIVTNMIYVDPEGKVDHNYKIVIVDDAPEGGGSGYDVSVSSTYQVEIMDIFKHNHGVLSWFPVKDFDFDINYSIYGQYSEFVDECDKLSKKITYKHLEHTKDTSADSDGISTQEESLYGIKELAKSPFSDDYGNNFQTEYEYYLEQFHPDLCLLSKTAPYISKWGYYDEQKDSCENPYRLNVSKVFGVSNLSANTYLRNCDENEYTHSMPYYMILNTPDYYKDYQYIESDEAYKDINISDNGVEQYIMTVDDNDNADNFYDCVNYWIHKFKDTDNDAFSDFFSGKKYGKRFDRKYSRLLGGNKFHNPSTLFRGVKFEVVRQYNGVEKKSSEYNNYRFSFVYIPIMIDSLIFNSTVYFVKNDTFKFIVGIIFVNTMLGTYNHNIFNNSIDYFGKGFLYAACKDLIRPENTKDNEFYIKINNSESDDSSESDEGRMYSNSVWNDNYVMGHENKFYMWLYTNSENSGEYVKNKIIFVTDESGNPERINSSEKVNVIGVIDTFNSNDNDDIYNDIKNIKKPDEFYSSISYNENKFTWVSYYKEMDVKITRRGSFDYYGEIDCNIVIPNIEFKNITVIDVCDINWDYKKNGGYIADVSNINFKSESLQNILINMGTINSVESITFYNGDVVIPFSTVEVDILSGSVKIKTSDTIIEGNDIENLKMDITIKDRFDTNLNSLGFKDYFSLFNQISAYSISNNINNDYNVKYYSTTEDNKYKIRVVNPDSIEIIDKNEAYPVKVTQNNKSVVGSVEIKEKVNSNRIGKKIINRYSGYYNPIFNDILYYGDYTYTTSMNRLRNVVKNELAYSNTNIDYNYNDGYGNFGVIKNLYYHKTNISRSDKILTSERPVYPAINEYALDYRDYNVFSSNWDEGYFISQDDINNSSICGGIGSMKDGLCMFGSKYLNLPDDIFIDTFVKGQLWDDTMVTDIRDNTGTEIMYKEINNNTVRYYLFIEKRLKRYLTDNLLKIFEKYINKTYSFGDKETIYDDVEEYVEKNLLKLYKVDKVYLYVKNERMGINNKMIENEYLKFMDKTNKEKIKNGFPDIDGKLTDSKFIMSQVNEFDRFITYNLNRGFKESFGIGVSFKRK